MQIEGIGDKILLNDEVVSRKFPFGISYEGNLIYEVVRIRQGYPLFWREHLERMINSLNLIGQEGKRIVQGVEGKIRSFIQSMPYEENNIKIIIGNFSGMDFDYMVYYIPSFYPDASYYEKGVHTVAMQYERQNPNAKIINLKLTEKVSKIRKSTGAYEVVLINTEGIVTEGSRSNLFFLKDHCIHVSQGHKILKGITMIKVIELLKKIGVKYKEDNVLEDSLDTFDACFMTSTSNNVLPIDTIDDIRFDSSHHSTVKALIEAFKALMDEDQAIYKTIYKEEL